MGKKRKRRDTSPRDRLLETVTRLFYQQGYKATGITQIIDEAEVAKASFYQYFPSKQDLCLAYLEERHLSWMRNLQMAVETIPDPEKRLYQIFDYLEKWSKKMSYRGCPFLNISAEIPEPLSPLRRMVLRHKNSLIKYLATLLENYYTVEGVMREVDVEARAQSLYVLYEGAIVSSANYGKVWPIKAAREMMEKCLLVG